MIYLDFSSLAALLVVLAAVGVEAFEYLTGRPVWCAQQLLSGGMIAVLALFVTGCIVVVL